MMNASVFDTIDSCARVLWTCDPASMATPYDRLSICAQDNLRDTVRAVLAEADSTFDIMAFASNLERAMARTGLSFRGLQMATGIDQATIHRTVRHAKIPSAEHYLRLRRWMYEQPSE